MKKIGRFLLLPVLLAVNIFLKVMYCLMDFWFDDMPEHWHWAKHGVFNNEDYAPFNKENGLESDLTNQQ